MATGKVRINKEFWINNLLKFTDTSNDCQIQVPTGRKIVLNSDTGIQANCAFDMNSQNLDNIQDANIQGNVQIDGNCNISGNCTIQGTTTTIDTQNLNVTDKLVTLNKGGVSGEGIGLEFEKNSSIQGYIKTDANQTFKIKHPDNTKILTIPQLESDQTLLLKQNVQSQLAAVVTQQNVPKLFNQQTVKVSDTVFYVLCGKNDLGVLQDKIYKCDLSSNQFTQVTYTGTFQTLQNFSALYHSGSNSIYIAGGDQDAGSLTKFYKFNLSTLQITELSGVPQSIMLHKSFLYNNKMYVVGGLQNNYSNMYTYDFTSESWSMMTGVFMDINKFGFVVDGSNLYIFGGQNHSGVYYNKIQVFDLSNNTYQDLTGVTGTLNQYVHDAEKIGDYVYLYCSGSNQIQQFQISTKTIGTMSPLTDELRILEANMFNDGQHIYLVMGYYLDNSEYQTVTKINLQSNAFEIVDFPTMQYYLDKTMIDFSDADNANKFIIQGEEGLQYQQFVQHSQGGLNQDLSQIFISGNDGKFLKYDNAQNKVVLDTVSTTIDDLSITTAKLQDEAVTNEKLADDAVQTLKIQDGAVTNAKIFDLDRQKLSPENADYVVINDGSGILSSEQFLDKTRGGLGQDVSQLATSGNNGLVLYWNNVSGQFDMKATDIQLGSITEEFLAQDSVSTDKIQTDAITTSKIGDSQITNAKISDVGRDKIQMGSMDHVVINDNLGQLSSEQYLDRVRGGLGQDVSLLVGASNDLKFLQWNDTLSQFQMAVVDTNIPDLSITTAKIDDQAVTNEKLADDAVQTSKIQDNAVTDAKIYSVGRQKLSPGTNDYVLINDGSGLISEEQYLSTQRGGLGQDLSSSTGILKVNSGTFSAVQTISNAEIEENAGINLNKLEAVDTNDKKSIAYFDGTSGLLQPIPSQQFYYDSNKLYVEPVSNFVTKKGISFTNDDDKFIDFTVDTNDSTPTPLFVISLTQNKTYAFDYRIYVHNNTDNSSGAYLKGSFRVDMGSSPGQCVIDHFIELESMHANCQVSISGDNSQDDTFKIIVTGLNSTSLKWKALMFQGFV